MQFRVLVMIVVLLYTLVSCANTPNASTNANTPNASTNANIPTTEQGTTPQAFVVPTPGSDKVGTVTGKLIRVRKKDGEKPLAKAPLYLGTVLKSNQGAEGLVSLDKGTAPKTTVDAQGNFAFINVPPGRYGLMIETPIAVVLLNQPDSGNNMIVDVKGGKVVDLGELKYAIDVEY